MYIKRYTLCGRKNSHRYLDYFILFLSFSKSNRQGRAEDFQISVALTYVARVNIFSATPKLLSVTPSFWLLAVALMIR